MEQMRSVVRGERVCSMSGDDVLDCLRCFFRRTVSDEAVAASERWPGIFGGCSGDTRETEG